jgi:hypothetical protein
MKSENVQALKFNASGILEEAGRTAKKPGRIRGPEGEGKGIYFFFTVTVFGALPWSTIHVV